MIFRMDFKQSNGTTESTNSIVAGIKSLSAKVQKAIVKIEIIDFFIGIFLFAVRTQLQHIAYYFIIHSPYGLHSSKMARNTIIQDILNV